MRLLRHSSPRFRPRFEHTYPERKEHRIPAARRSFLAGRGEKAGSGSFRQEQGDAGR